MSVGVGVGSGRYVWGREGKGEGKLKQVRHTHKELQAEKSLGGTAERNLGENRLRMVVVAAVCSNLSKLSNHHTIPTKTKASFGGSNGRNGGSR